MLETIRASEVVITTSSQDNVIEVWDIRSGAVVASFKGNQSLPKTLSVSMAPNIPSQSGLFTHIMASAQADRPVVHIWSWQKVRT
jgi:WD40 repeat protein